MGNKKKKDAKPKKEKDKSKIDERAKQAMSITPPDENPWFIDNENAINRFRFRWPSNSMTRKEKSRKKK